nr:hypothetical protein [Terriglobales bacterium]
AEYDSRQGHLLLKSNIVFSTQRQGQPAQLNAARAIYDRNENQVHLWQVQYSSKAVSGTAGTATILMRDNQSAEWLDAKAGVKITSSDGMTVRAPAAHVLLSETNQPQEAQLSGGVELDDNQPTQNLSGSAEASELDFNDQGRPTRISSDRNVKFNQQTDTGSNRLLRTLASHHLILYLLPVKTGRPQLRSADATGSAIFTSKSIAPGHAPLEMVMSAETLKADFAAGNQLQQINGAGQTRLQTIAADGDVDTSTGDTLQMEFTHGQASKTTMHSVPESPALTGSTAGIGSNSLTAQSIRTAVQTGHVVLQQARKAHNGNTSPTPVSTATASRATYVSANDTLTLTGEPVYQDEQLQLMAHHMEVQRVSGKMIATGSVQATLHAGHATGEPVRNGAGGLMGGNQPTHIIAEQVVLVHSTQTAIFSGRARLWQGGDIVEAPVIEVSQKMQTLRAHGDSACTLCVITNFLSAVSSPTQPNRDQTIQRLPSNFRVLSDELLYSDAEKKATFFHHVQVTCSSGLLTGDDAEVFLLSTKNHSTGKSGLRTEENIPQGRNNVSSSSVERIVTTGNVRLLQPGRRATGTRLVYTVADGHFVLTGDATNTPTVIDVDHGTVTGQVLTFASREQAIMVSGSPGQMTTTTTRVQKK